MRRPQDYPNSRSVQRDSEASKKKLKQSRNGSCEHSRTMLKCQAPRKIFLREGIATRNISLNTAHDSPSAKECQEYSHTYIHSRGINFLLSISITCNNDKDHNERLHLKKKRGTNQASILVQAHYFQITLVVCGRSPYMHRHLNYPLGLTTMSQLPLTQVRLTRERLHSTTLTE